MRVMCIYRTGGDYDADYVFALKYAVTRYLGEEHTFHCITNDPDSFRGYDMGVIRMNHDWPGWWSKLELFRPDLESVETTIYFDLDILIKFNIKAFTEACRRSSTPIMLRSADPIGEGHDWPSSSIMSWKGKAMNKMWRAWISNPMGNIQATQKQMMRAGQKTDQGFIRHHVTPRFFQDELIKNYIVFKLHYMKESDLFDSCHILNWTGKPRFKDMNPETSNRYQNKEHYWDIWSLWEGRVRLGKSQFRIGKNRLA